MSGPKSSTILTNKRGRLVVPAGERWDDLFLNGPRATDDFFADRDQPSES